jgi:thiamine biosynthesis lipoprotein
MAQADRFHAGTGGIFDVAVQPLWDLYAGHFSRPDADPAGPPAAAIAAAVARGGQHRMRLASDRITLAPGMAVTLNAIAQGYVTDRVAELLRHRALGPWQVGLEDPAAPGRVAETIGLEDAAVATSGGHGTRFDAAGRFNHIFDPTDGRSSWRYGAVSVVVADATTADALAIAFCLLTEERIAALARTCCVRVHLACRDGTRMALG